MLIDIKRLNKTYKTTGGVTHRALANINLRFGDKGLVFIVGKSGSGKSTLLNMLGALDRYDSGTITVGGRDLGRLGARDLDNYRNTMIGFIFQEPNLIENLSVLKNVKLTLDLQKAPDASGTAKRALASVGLADKADTNVQDLSGGQRQRVSIARAIAKDPQILLADEPTGALDSATGESITALLKEISKDRLVIVVTHDMETATKCGDRIIEIKDSKVYRDIMPRPAGYVESKADISFISDVIVKVAPGERFDDAVAGKLNAIVGESGCKTFVNVDTDKNKMKALFPNLREAIDADSARLTEEGELEYKGRFVPFETADTEQTSIALKKGRLPLHNAVYFGFNNLKHRTVRLIFTIMMTVISLGLFGFVQTINMFDRNAAVARATVESGYSSVLIGNKASRYDSRITKLVPGDLNNITGATEHSVTYMYENKIYPDKDSVSPYFLGFAEANDLACLGFKCLSGDITLTGDQPLTDVVISETVARKLAADGMADSAAAMTGRSFDINGVRHTVKGVFRSDSHFPQSFNYDSRSIEYDEFYRRDGYMYVKEGYREISVDTYSIGTAEFDIKTSGSGYFTNESATALFDSEIGEWLGLGNNIKAIMYDEIAGGGNSLEAGEIFIGQSLLGEIGMRYGDGPGAKVTVDALNSYAGRELVLYSDKSLPLFATDAFKIKGVITSNSYYTDENGQRVDFEMQDGFDASALASSIVFSETDRRTVLANAIASNYARIGLDKSDGDNEKLVYALTDSGYMLIESFSSYYDDLAYALSVISIIMLCVAGVMCLLAALMLYGYLSSSVKLTTKHIGILRGLGAKLTDCFKIYVIEGLVVSLIAFAAAAVLVAVIAPIVNAALSAELSFPCFLLLPVAPVYLMMAGIAVAVSVVSVLLPLRKLTKISPVEAIFGKH